MTINLQMAPHKINVVNNNMWFYESGRRIKSIHTIKIKVPGSWKWWVQFEPLAAGGSASEHTAAQLLGQTAVSAEIQNKNTVYNFSGCF